MRSHPIYCDWCQELVAEHLIVYSHKLLVPHATYEGARETYDFCSEAHLVAWKDHNALIRLVEKRTRRMTVRADAGAVDEYRAQLLSEIDDRLSAAMERPRVAATREP